MWACFGKKTNKPENSWDNFFPFELFVMRHMDLFQWEKLFNMVQFRRPLETRNGCNYCFVFFFYIQFRKFCVFLFLFCMHVS